MPRVRIGNDDATRIEIVEHEDVAVRPCTMPRFVSDERDPREEALPELFHHLAARSIHDEADGIGGEPDMLVGEREPTAAAMLRQPRLDRAPVLWRKPGQEFRNRLVATLKQGKVNRGGGDALQASSE